MCLQIECNENSAPILWNLVIFPHSLMGKESAWKAGDPGPIPGLGRPHGEGNGNPLQYTCLENPMDRGAWRATVHGVARVGHDIATKPPTCEIQPQTHYLDLIKREHQINPNWKSFGKMTSLELFNKKKSQGHEGQEESEEQFQNIGDSEDLTTKSLLGGILWPKRISLGPLEKGYAGILYISLVCVCVCVCMYIYTHLVSKGKKKKKNYTYSLLEDF